MVHKYERKSDRAATWTEESMKLALHAIQHDKITIRAAARMFVIPYPTLRKHVMKNSAEKVRRGVFNLKHSK